MKITEFQQGIDSLKKALAEYVKNNPGVIHRTFARPDRPSEWEEAVKEIREECLHSPNMWQFSLAQGNEDTGEMDIEFYLHPKVEEHGVPGDLRAILVVKNSEVVRVEFEQ